MNDPLPRRFLSAGAGQGGSNAAPSPRTPLPGSTTKTLTDADHSSMIRNALRRFAPTVIGITRNGDRHQIGMSDRHRRNTQPALWNTNMALNQNGVAGVRGQSWGPQLWINSNIMFCHAMPTRL
jgi:hypothetical protein